MKSNNTFRFFSYSYGSNLATTKVIFWLISINILSLLIAAIEFYAWTDAAKNHISESSGIYVGLITGIVLWVFDQWLIATDTTEFERLGKTKTLNISLAVRAIIFIVSIAATSYFLAIYLGRKDANEEIKKHNQAEVIKINKYLTEQLAKKNEASKNDFDTEKTKIDTKITEIETEIEGYKMALEKKQPNS